MKRLPPVQCAVVPVAATIHLREAGEREEQGGKEQGLGFHEFGGGGCDVTKTCHSERSEEPLIICFFWNALEEENSQRCFASLNMTGFSLRMTALSLDMRAQVVGHVDRDVRQKSRTIFRCAAASVSAKTLSASAY